MAYQGIGTGTTPNDGTGDDLLSGAIKINSNFEEIYSALGDGSNLLLTEVVQDAVGSAINAGIQTGISVTYDDFNNSINFFVDFVDSLSISGDKSTGIAVTSYNNSVDHSYLNLYGARGTQSSPSIINYRDVTGSFSSYAYNGSTFDKIGYINFRSDGTPPSTPSSGNVPGSIVIGLRDDTNNLIPRQNIDLYGASQFFGKNSVIFSKTQQPAGLSYATFVGQHSATYSGDNIGAGTNSVLIYSNGDIYNSRNVYSVISDISLKENIQPANSQWDDIKNLRVVNFNFKVETGQQTHRQIGLIAQEVEEVSPGLVDTVDNFYDSPTKTVKTSVISIKMLKALQEAMERIEKLEKVLRDNGISLD